MSLDLLPSRGANLAAPRILIVEDEGLVAMDLKNRLTAMGYDVVAMADTANDAVTASRQVHPDIILMDIHLRGTQDGIDAAAGIRRTLDVPIIFVTAHADEATLQRAGLTEPFGYVLKPFDERELRASIEMARYRHRAETRLRKMERWLATTLQSVADGILATDGEGRIMFLNPVAEAVSGWSRREAIGRDVTEVLNLEDSDSPGMNVMPNLVREAMAHGLVLQLGENRVLIRRDGERTPVDDSIAPIRNDEDAIVGCVIIIRDASSRKMAEEEQRKLEAKMQEAQRLESLGVLASGIAHDFNNLLVAVTCNASLGRILSGKDRELLECFDQIEKAGERASLLCNQMLAYAGKGKYLIEDIELSAFANETAQLIEIAIAKNARIVSTLSPNLPPIRADRSQLQQVIMNLVMNASDALHEAGGTIKLTTGLFHADRKFLEGCRVGLDLPEAEYVMLEVADNGCGMTAETLQRIFDPFFTTKFTGRGLGLSAVIGIVRSHGGALAVRSSVGEGTTFQVLFPPAQEAVTEHAPPSPTLSWRGSGHVLLVDDETSVQLAGSAALRHLGFTVDVAADGLQAVAKVTSAGGAYRLVLLDLSMPNLDGVGAREAIRLAYPNLPIVLMSGYSEEQASRMFRNIEGSAFLKKPFTIRSLIEKLSALV